MKAAVLHQLGQIQYGNFREPVGEHSGHEVVAVLAAGVNHVDIAKASGQFYTAPPPLPSVVGSDGVGLTADGRRVYFERCVEPYGSLAERTVVESKELLPLLDCVPTATGAALGNAGTAAAIALIWRGKMARGDRVLILGATGAVGNIATQLAVAQGAGLVVAVGRDQDKLSKLSGKGLLAITLEEDSSVDRYVEQFGSASPDGFDVIVDLVCGDPGNAGLRCSAIGARYVQVGAKAGADLHLPAALLRSRLLTVTGTAGFLEHPDDRAAAYSMLQTLVADDQIDVETETFDLADVEAAWHRQQIGAGVKLVMTSD